MVTKKGQLSSNKEQIREKKNRLKSIVTKYLYLIISDLTYELCFGHRCPAAVKTSGMTVAADPADVYFSGEPRSPGRRGPRRCL